jgi:hypothetical protein
MEEGKIINLTDKLTLSKWDKNSKNEVNPKWWSIIYIWVNDCYN